jgi:DNA-binding protein HU-beta
MNKKELINKVSETTGLSKKESEAAVEATLDTIGETLAEGEKVSLMGFGNFEVRTRAARKGRNPQTNAEIDIPESKNPAWKPSKKLKEIINQ